MADIEKKFLRVRKQMKRQGIECLIIPPSSNLLYLTGNRGFMMERPSFLMLFIEKAYYVSPAFEAPDIQKRLGDYADVISWEEEENPYEIVGNEFGKKKVRAAMDLDAPVFLYYRLKAHLSGWSWVSDLDIMGEVRMRKDKEEIALIGRAQEMSADAFVKFLDHGICNMTELEAAKLLQKLLIEEGLEASLPIVATGSNGALPHHGADFTMIKEGDAVVIDFGGAYHGYHSDTTRTVVVKYASDYFKEVYQIVQTANQKAYACVKEGVTCGFVDSVARKVIRDSGFGEYFTHRLGHGIGLDIHEPPYLVGNNQARLAEGNVFSNEPGIYLPGRFGIRIEDLIAVKDGKGCVLGKLSHELQVVE